MMQGEPPLCSGFSCKNLVFTNRMLQTTAVDAVHVSKGCPVLAAIRARNATEFNKLTAGTDSLPAESSEEVCLLEAVTIGRADFSRSLLARPSSLGPASERATKGAFIRELFLTAARNGHAELLEHLVSYPCSFSPELPSTEVMEIVAQSGRVDMVEIMLAGGRWDPDMYSVDSSNDPLSVSAAAGHAAVVKQLLDEPGPWLDRAVEFHGGLALCLAAQAGHLDVLELLLADERIDPNGTLEFTTSTARYEFYPRQTSMAPLAAAAEAAQLEAARLLLADPRVDPSHKEQDAIRRAARSGHAELPSCCWLTRALTRRLKGKASTMIGSHRLRSSSLSAMAMTASCRCCWRTRG